MSTSKIGASKPKKSSLISNLLNRVDDKSLAVKAVKDKKQNESILIYWEVQTEKHLKCNREILSFLSESQLYQLFEFGELAINSSINMFEIETFLPENNKEKKEKKAILVQSYKEIDKVGVSKGEQEIFKKAHTVVDRRK